MDSANNSTARQWLQQPRKPTIIYFLNKNECEETQALTIFKNRAARLEWSTILENEKFQLNFSLLVE